MLKEEEMGEPERGCSMEVRLPFGEILNKKIIAGSSFCACRA